MTAPVCRFAPSPNGYLHLGHALSALVGYETARQAGGRFLVRIEDIDEGRAREAFVTAIFEDLSWLGLTWEQPVLRQSQHFERYRRLAERLADMGLLYRCYATRADIAQIGSQADWPRDPDGAPRWTKAANFQQPSLEANGDGKFALRLDMERALKLARKMLAGRPLTFVEIDDAGHPATIAADPNVWGDAVIVRKDTPASYHLAVVADDAFQGVTLVTRGRDLYAATSLHRLLQVLLELPEPTYSHHRLILAGDGRKLAKSAGDTSLRELRARGAAPGTIRAMLQLE